MSAYKRTDEVSRELLAVADSLDGQIMSIVKVETEIEVETPADDLVPNGGAESVFKIEPGDLPDEQNIDPPPYHKFTDACSYGAVGYPNDKATWLACDCEDPANPWPPRLSTDGPVNCECSLCNSKPRIERGREPCEYASHHCESCHAGATCTTIECKKEFGT